MIPSTEHINNVARLKDVSLFYGKTCALDTITVDIPAGKMVGLIGPDGVGKSSMMSLIAGARRLQKGSVEVFGGDMKNARHRREIFPRIAYMPQGLGKNLYYTLSVFENLDYFGSLFALDKTEREARISVLLENTGLASCADRPVGKLSGGMKQKLGLCCALIHDPDLLILDEPTTGVDPLSRRQFWNMISDIRYKLPGMSVIVATAYMEEAGMFDWLVAMDRGQVLSTGTPDELLERTSSSGLEEAFIKLLPAEKRRGYKQLDIPPLGEEVERKTVIEATGLTKRFGDFIAVDKVSFRIKQGEIFGFLGSNGCGKTTTMKMLAGLLEASEGESRLFGRHVDPNDMEIRKRIGYMSQGFSLYSELTVRQNLELHARLFNMPDNEISSRVEQISDRFDLHEVMNSLPGDLPLGQRQRLSLGVALIHKPDILILDEPTSGVDPIARDRFWHILVELARRDNVTIFISTHFMNEAERCDRISFMHAGRVLVSDIPEALVEQRGVTTIEDAFISCLEYAEPSEQNVLSQSPMGNMKSAVDKSKQGKRAYKGVYSKYLNIDRILNCTKRETLELYRDPIRLVLAILGSAILLFVMGYGISMDVENLTFGVLDMDQTTVSNDYVLNLAGSRYFVEHAPVISHSEMDKRMRSGELNLALEIPHGFARDISRGRNVEIGAWIDGSMPARAETVEGYVNGMHTQWLLSRGVYNPLGNEVRNISDLVETRFRYNPDVKSLISMVPATIPLLLIFIPAMIAALSIVREKELGSIVNLYVTPVSRFEFIIGKQIPYVILGIINFLMLYVLAVTVFDVPMKGSFMALTAGAILYVIATTSLGLLISTFMKKQITAIFGTSVLTMLPAVSFSGLIEPVSSLQGIGAVIGRIYPTTHFLTICRGTFSKALGFSDLTYSFIPLLIVIPVLIALSTLLLKKQEK